MLPFLPIPLLLITAVTMQLIRLVRPRFGFFWLAAILGMLISWPLLFLARLSAASTNAPGAALRIELPLPAWRPEQFFSVSPALVLDDISWPYAMALITISVAALLTDILRATHADGWSWTAILAATSLGLAAVTSGNLLTLLLTWIALDLFELATVLLREVEPSASEQTVIAIGMRVVASFVIYWAILRTGSPETALLFNAISPESKIYLIIAASLRLGVLPFYAPVATELPLRRGLGTLLRLAPAAASLALLARIASFSLPTGAKLLLLLFTALAGLYGAISWAVARGNSDDRIYWIMGVASLSIAAALQAQTGASLAWGLALLLCGAQLFLFSIRSRLLLALPVLSLLGFTTLPFTPTWQTVHMFSTPLQPLLLPFPLIHALLMAGYLQRMLTPGVELERSERWILAIYPWGLALLVIVHNVLVFFCPLLTPFDKIQRPSILTSWPGLASLVLAILTGLLYLRGPRLPQRLTQRAGAFFSLGWIYRFLGTAYHSLRLAPNFISAILEGEAGFLWTILFLVLLFSVIIQSVYGF